VEEDADGRNREEDSEVRAQEILKALSHSITGCEAEDPTVSYERGRAFVSGADGVTRLYQETRVR
jgi:hypothetical protein